MAQERVQRRLAAILAADVAGYSRLMGADEEGTLADLNAHRAEHIEPCIADHGGRVVKTTGDGLLAEFASVVDAVRCAAEIQQGMAARTRDVAGDRRIAFRVGINLGDIIVQDDDVYGDGVNLAARLEGIAEPGGICVSRNVFEQVEGHTDLGFDDLGERQLKNIARPMRVYAVAPPVSGDAGPAAAPPAPALPDRPSIAVLPFENMSADPEQEYFADGISEDIITDLSKISGLFVIARNSSFVYKGKPVSIRQVGRELGVRCVLEGSVRKAGSRVRITAQLIDATDDSHLWAERYDGGLDDVFALQDEVTRKVVSALQVTLTSSERQALAPRQNTDIESYDLLLKARQLHLQFTPEANTEACRLLEAALERDPDYAEAMALLAECRLVPWNQGWSANPDVSLGPAADLAARAVALKPDSAACHMALGWAASWQRRHDLALEECRRAVELDPNSARAHTILAMALNWAGQFEAAIAEAEIAARLDPAAPAVQFWTLGHACYFLGRYDEALAHLRESARLNPNFMPAYIYLAATSVRLGDRDAAEAAAADLLRNNPNLSTRMLGGFVPYRDPAHRDALFADLAAAGVSE